MAHDTYEKNTSQDSQVHNNATSYKNLSCKIKIGPMKNKLDTLQMVMLGYLISIMAAFYNFTQEYSWCAKKRQEV